MRFLQKLFRGRPEPQAASKTSLALPFRTTEVAQLYDQVRSSCHADYPFLHANYSRSSMAAACDYTPFIAACLSAGKIEPIAELWDFLMPGGSPFNYMFRKAMAARLPPWVLLSSGAINELRAIYILTTRAAYLGNQHVANVASRLAATTLGCATLQVDGGYLDEFTRITRSEVNDQRVPGSVYGKKEGARLAIEQALSPLGGATAAAELLSGFAPTVRLVVYDFFHRGWGYGTLRFDLYYDERMYGCNAEQTEHAIDQLGFFGPPDDSAQLSATVTKDLLRAALEKRGIVVKKAETRKQMIEIARTIPGLLSSVMAEMQTRQQNVKGQWGSTVRDWAARVQYVESVGGALIKLLALSGIK